MTAEKGMSCMPMTREGGREGGRGRPIEQQTNGIVPFFLSKGFSFKWRGPAGRAGWRRAQLRQERDREIGTLGRVGTWDWEHGLPTTVCDMRSSTADETGSLLHLEMMMMMTVTVMRANDFSFYCYVRVTIARACRLPENEGCNVRGWRLESGWRGERREERGERVV